MIDSIKFSEKLDKINAINSNSLSLAFVGDSVWTLLVRDFFCSKTDFKNNDLHKLSTKFIKATYQAEALDKIYENLTDAEKNIARRARNTKMHTVSKNAPLSSYKKATGFEAILGFLYLTNDFNRIKEIFNLLSNDFWK